MSARYRSDFVEACLGGDPEARRWYSDLVRVVDEVVRPGAAARDEAGTYPHESVEALRSIGAFGVSIPREQGGIGLSAGMGCLAVETLAHGCPSVAAILMFHLQVARRTLRFGSEHLLAEHLPRLASGEWLGASAWSEAGSGSDKSRPATCLEPREPGRWTARGAKAWCTGLEGASVFHVLLAAPGPDGRPAPTFVAVPRDEHVEVEPLDLLGLRASSTGELRLLDAPVDERAVILGLGEAPTLMQANHESCIHPGAIALGIARACAELATELALGTRPGCRDLTGFQDARFKLARIELHVGTAYSAAAHAVRLAESNTPGLSSECMKLKVVAGEAAQAIAAITMQLAGAKGFDRAVDVQRHFRDAQATHLMGPTNEIVLERIAARVIENHRAERDLADG